MIESHAKRGLGIPKWIRLIVSAALLALIAVRMDWNQFFELVRRSSPPLLLIALGVSVLAIVLSAYKWGIVLSSLNLEAPFGILVSSYFVGLFFNNFLPTNIGGDVVRAAHLARISQNAPAAVASVVAERVIAASSLGLVSLIALAIDYQKVERFVILIAAFGVLCAGMIAACLAGNAIGRGVKRARFAAADKISEALTSLSASLKNPSMVARVLALSIAFHAMVVAINALIFRAMGLDVPLIVLLAFIPVISAVSMLPVSINGLGVREASYAYFFGISGVSTAQAVAASLAFYALVTLTSLVGGIILAVEK
mgnify:CR=1 FL=1